MKRALAGFGCAWVLWSAPVEGPGSGSATWTVVATVGGSHECTAATASVKRAATGTPLQYICLPEGEWPPRR
jgi:hypothetical protein